MKIRILAIFLAVFIAQPALAAQLPVTEMDDLAGKTMHIPADFTGKPTLVIFAFAHEQRDEAKRVITLLQKAQETNKDLSWYELPVIDAPSIAHYFIKDGMRSGTDKELHAHIVPQFVDEKEWRRSSGITSADPILAKIDNEGRILKTAPLSSIKTADDITSF